MRKILIGVGLGVLVLGGSLAAWTILSPGGGGRPVLAEVPPLKPFSKPSTVVTPVAVTLSAIRTTLEARAPRDLAGKRENPLTELLGKADIGWTIARGPLAVTGRPDGLTIATPLNGSLRAVGQLSNQAGNLTGSIAGLLGGNLGGRVQDLTTKAFDQRADIRGNVTITAKPALQANWRIEPHLTGQVALADTSMNLAGFRLNVANEVKPLLDRAVNEQMAAVQAQLRNDPTLEVTARREWAKLCRSVSIGKVSPGAPNLWLEIRPTRAYAAQPRIDQSAVTLTVGVQAETRVTTAESKPNCPFPRELEFVQALDHGRFAIALPVEVPWTDVSRLVESQLKGKTFPEDGSGPAAVTVLGAKVAASGDRLLISLKIKARETKSWFGLGGDADVHVWGKPVVDRDKQILRLGDIELDVQSEAAFGLLGAAARAAVPYLQSALGDAAMVDLKPLALSARKSIEAAVAEFQKQDDSVRADAAITGLRLTGIEFDAKTLRLIGEADGTVKVAVTKLAQ
jgi:hypothetical protein